MEICAFTRGSSKIEERLVSDAEIIYNGKKINTDRVLWDTGATQSCISKKVANELGLTSENTKNVTTAVGKRDVKIYNVDIKLPSGYIISNTDVLESDIEEQSIDLLIGMDIICKGDFSVSNFNGKTVFSFRCPSVATTDYYKLLASMQPASKIKIQPNEQCPCGSGRKYKKCCGKNR